MGVLRTALYCRLSKDDMAQGDSESIKTQKAMLTQYAKEHNFLVVEVYVDDGWSGLNFDRPDFNRMLDDIEAGKIDVVITKDLSRLGRDHLKVGHFTEIYFPMKNVRYIAAQPVIKKDGLMMKNIDMKITEEIAVLSVSGSGYTKEINLVSWNGAEPKFDIRSWSPGREKCGKGIALTQGEAKNLFLALQKVLSE